MLAWGNFVTIAINFLIIAWVLFLVVKAHQPHAARRQAEVDAAESARAAGRREAAAGDPRHPGKTRTAAG